MENNRPALTPSAVNNYLKTILEKDKYMSFFKLKGEISNLKYHSNGNMYFSVKDEGAAINCIMFKSYAIRLTDKFSEGDQIEIEGSLYLYVKMGQYNINVRSMEKAGVGDLYKRYEQLKKEFELKGYFNQSHKQAIPKYPQTIGVVTSKTGAAVQDIITTLKRRYPIAKVRIYPTLVQGVNAKEDVVKNIRLANNEGICDVLIVGRGGGSIEDLWAFNEKIVVEAIYQSSIPIISSVGHETDTTLSDYVADVRVPTPTAAAEVASPNILELREHVNGLREVMVKSLESKVTVRKLRLDNIVKNQYFSNPLIKFELELDEINTKVENSQLRLEHKIKMLNSILANDKNLIDSLNPLTILSKGYSVSKVNDTIIKSTKELNVGDQITTEFTDGYVKTTIIDIKEYDG